jgi:hypothetical protein
MFDFPPRLIGKRSRAHGKGLAYARALAEEMNWELQLANQSRPTTFDLILKDINLFEKGLQP